jgi:hypothetical protein
MQSAKDALAALPKPKKRQKGKSNRKHGRNYRWDGQTHSTTKYRARHGIPNGPRK